jgi:hypothetical protein
VDGQKFPQKLPTRRAPPAALQRTRDNPCYKGSMGRSFHVPRNGGLPCLAFCVAGLLAAYDAEPCGILGSREGRRPSLAYEQVLLLHDPATEQEHFIRSVTFRTEARPFGFVVPTPSRPTVAEIKANPFPALRESYPFDPPPPSDNTFGKGHGPAGWRRECSTGDESRELHRIRAGR